MDLSFQKCVLLVFGLLITCQGYAATAINLRHSPVALLQFANNGMAMREMSREMDSNNNLHIRLQETFQGFEVYGGDAVLHIHGKANRTRTMNGIIYHDLQADLAATSSAVFTKSQSEKALRSGLEYYQQQMHEPYKILRQTSKLLVWPGKDNKAHWAYRISFRSEPVNADHKPVLQVYIMDAETFEIYASWDDIPTLVTTVEGGGFGGNPKLGQVIFDGLTNSNHFAKLMMTRNDANTCFLQNNGVTVMKVNSGIMSFPCAAIDANHNNVYWNGAFDTINNGYSPANDALFSGQMVKEMYENWYGIPVLTNAQGKAAMLNLMVHKQRYEGAYWDFISRTMVFGDGYKMFYPLTTVDVAAHEISHGFTSQHSKLAYFGQAGAMNESFSDIAGNAAEFYAYGKNSWKIGAGITKAENKAIRYLDKPSRDCGSKSPGHLCSIDNAAQYVNGLDVHYASGVYNRFFYTLATTPQWDVKKAFELLVYANRYYWTTASTFNEGACNVISAAKQLNADVNAVKKAFEIVKVNYRC